MNTSIAFAATFVFAAAANANAGTLDASSSSVLGRMGTAPLDRPVTSDGSAFQISGSTAPATPSSVSLRLSRSESWATDKVGYFDTWTVSASAPISGANGPTQLATLDGLANGFNLKVKFSRLWAYGLRISNPDVEDAQRVIDAVVAECTSRFKSAEDIKANCGTKDIGALFSNYATDQQTQRYHDDFFGRVKGAAWDVVAGLQGGVGYNQFTFYDALTLAKTSANHVPWSAQAYLGVLPWRDAMLFTFAAEYQHAFTAATSATTCLPPPPSPLKCVSGALAPPTEKDKLLLSAEFRGLIPFNWASALIGPTKKPSFIGISPKFTYDAKSSVYGVDAPVYFAMDDKNNLVGGVDFGWTSDKHTFTVGLFVGSAFSIF